MTIYQVAEAAGVSISTVSLALNHPARVNPQTRERVIQVAGELGYRSGAVASERARRSSGRIAVMAPFSSYESYRTRLVGILDGLAPHHIEVVVHDAPPATEPASPLLETLPVRGDVDGLLLMGIPLGDEGADRLHRWGPPTVLVDSVSAAFTSVTFDDEQAGYLLARHLLDRGHRRLAYLHEPYHSPVLTSAGQLRLNGVARALGETAGAEPAIDDVALAGNDVAAARAGAAAFAGRADRPSAVIAHHDLLAAGFLAGLRAAGTRTPEEVAVAGFDDGPLAEVLGLTTVRQPFADSGHRAAELLLSLIQHPRQTPVRTLLAPQLVVRETT
ncbi:LacI family DNA-binding transcriptional regulator [Streptomyces sp. NPDC006733]|uniref:LacI family DNA-binding transcriptional regulator n=1 Tax=Streptomyces sp. NPDC006733 TaxID=3155460 RepID=UPI0033C7CC23